MRAAKQKKIPNLSVHKNTQHKRDHRKIWESLKTDALAMEKDIDGYALVTYKRDPDGVFLAKASYFVRNPMDAAGLPELARQELVRAYMAGRV